MSNLSIALALTAGLPVRVILVSEIVTLPLFDTNEESTKEVFTRPSL